MLRRQRIATADPATTLGAVGEFLRDARRELGPLAGLGIASFGPVQLDPAAPDYGRILVTPKPGWQGAAILETLAQAAACPAAIDTDVNVAALAEVRLGAGAGCGDLVYVTVGTGIGAGVISGGRPVHGLLHPEAGHMKLRRHPADVDFAGVCPFHGDCCEGLASGPAIAARSGAPAEALDRDHPHWAIVADTLGQLCAALTLALSPQRMVLGGGVMNRGHLFPAIRTAAAEALGGYIAPLRERAAVDALIVPPRCPVPGLAGAFLLAIDAAHSSAGWASGSPEG
ncbi:MAG: ROK family protein [Novosphingobium sp.]|nr:ROK family protein [Novosphingobium sp.]